jgi:hypothetical protein
MLVLTVNDTLLESVEVAEFLRGLGMLFGCWICLAESGRYVGYGNGARVVMLVLVCHTLHKKLLPVP